jgi:hypothetical protein
MAMSRFSIEFGDCLDGHFLKRYLHRINYRVFVFAKYNAPFNPYYLLSETH